MQGKDCVYVVVDFLTKFSHFFLVTISYSATQVVELFFARCLDCMDYHETLLVTEIVSL